MSDKLWNLGTTAAAVVGATFAKKVADMIWQKATSSEAPDDPEDPAVGWVSAVGYAVLSGAIVQLIRMVINRQSTNTYIKATGRHPQDKG